jgi:hypothetical protein
MKNIKVAIIIATCAISISTANADTTANSGSISGSNTTSTQGNAQNITFNGPEQPSTVTVRSVPGIIAPALTTTLTETCMGSTSAGIAGIGFGVSLGSTWRDADCVNRLNARDLRSLGDADAAKEVLCENQVVRNAYKRLGHACAIDAVKETKPTTDKPVTSK